MVRRKQLFRVLGIVVAVVITVFVIFFGAVNYYCNDEKIREIIAEYSDQNLIVDIDASEYSLNPLRRFPSMTLAVKDLVITTDRVKDSLYTPVAQDTLLVVEQADIAMSALPLFVGKFIFAGIYVNGVSANYTVEQDSTSNWDLFIEESKIDTLDVILDTDDNSPITGFGIRKFVITNANLIYNDKTSDSYLGMHDGALQLQGGMSIDRGLYVNVDFNADRLNYTQDNENILNNLSVGFQGALFVKSDSSAIVLNKTKLRLNDISLSCDGSIISDTTRTDNGVILDLQYSVDLPELKELWRVMPEVHATYMKDMNVSGFVGCTGSIYGPLNDNSLPHIDGEFKSEGVSFKHKDMLGSIDTLDIDVLLDLDLNDSKKQQLVVNRCVLAGTGIHAKFNGQITELLSDANVNIGAKLTIDAEKMLSLFPDTLGVIAKGNVDGYIRAAFRSSDITGSNYGKIKALGFLSIPQFNFELPTDSISLHIDSASMYLGSGKMTSLGGSIRWKRLEASLNKGNVFKTDSVRVALRSMQSNDTNAVVPFNADIKWHNLVAERFDRAWLRSKMVSLSGKVEPVVKNKSLPRVVLQLKSDSILFTPFQDRLIVNEISGSADAYCSDIDNNSWIATSNLKISDLALFTMHYPLEIKSNQLNLITDTNSVFISGSNIRVGRSDLGIDGKVLNVWNWLWNNDTVSMKLNVNSSRMNLNQLLIAMEEGNAFRSKLDSIILKRKDSTLIVSSGEVSNARIELLDHVANESIADTASPVKLNHVYVIPSNYNVDCNLKASRMVLGRWRMQNAVANFNLNEGILKLNEMHVNSSIGNILARGLYTAEDTTKAFAGFAFNMNDVKIANLLDIIPQFDTLMPMLHNLSGSVNLDMAVAGNWDQNMSVDMNSLTGAACLDGNNLVLMDGDTFSTIAKKLKFKNRERNLIDSLSVSLMLDDGTINVYPFILRLDRYRAAVGGKQNLDMSYKYHISILDSPIPFKFGLTISGDANDMKFKITKALYKNIFKPTSTYDVAKIRLDLKDKISDFLDDIADKSYGLPKFEFATDSDDEGADVNESDNEELSDSELEKALENYNEAE